MTFVDSQTGESKSGVIHRLYKSEVQVKRLREKPEQVKHQEESCSKARFVHINREKDKAST